MFLENNFAVPLFDFTMGGPPAAYKCLTCGKVTKGEQGMRAHLKSIHQWKEQPLLYSTDRVSVENNGEPRQLRAGPPLLLSQSQNESQPSVPLTEMSEEPSLNLTSEEK